MTRTSEIEPSTTVALVRPAMVSLNFAGDPNVSGRVTDAEVTCSYPGISGLQISGFAHSPASDVSYRMWISVDRVAVNVDVGTAADFRERNFEGAGVSDFDATKGARLDVRLRESAPSPGVGPGTIGVLESLTGSIDCGDQSPGSTSITVDGETSTGRYSRSSLDPALVECYFGSGQITVIGIARAGDRKVLLMISLGPFGQLGAEEAPPNIPQRHYEHLSGTGTLTPSGGTANGDVVEKDAAPAHRLHIEGHASCGMPLRG